LVKQPILAKMTRETDYLIQTLFEREGIEEMTLDELRAYSEQYPFSSIIQFLYTCKLKALYHLDFPETVSRTALFFKDPFWLDYQLNDEQDLGKFRFGLYENRNENLEEFNSSLGQNEYEDENLEELNSSLGQNEYEDENLEELNSSLGLDDDRIEEDEIVQEEILAKNNPSVTEENEIEINIPIEPYHTVDYFASQGIKLSHEEEKDELGKKVKSFTAWLKTMKRLQPEPENVSIKDPAVLTNSPITSIDSAEPILTESMAEVYLKQGLVEKAIEIYQKLSLQNPANSHIFASRISSIKENNI